MTILIRTDASAEIGAGHVMRCLALAQACADEGVAAEFVCRAIPPRLRRELLREGCRTHELRGTLDEGEDARETASLARIRGARWVVLDGYALGARFQDVLREQGLKVLFIDDYGHAERYPAEIVLNQNIAAIRDRFTGPSAATTLLLGPRFALLRREFSSRSHTPRPSEGRRHILVTLGGGDPCNVTSTVVEALRAVEDVEIKIVVGSANPHRQALQQACERAGMECLVHCTEMRKLMEWASIAVSATGSTVYELAYMGVPMLGIITAENQRGVAEGMEDAGALVNLGWHEDCSSQEIEAAVRKLLADGPTRARMARSGQALVDGRGAQRVCRSMKGPQVTVREANTEDARILWEWANDPAVRASSFSSDPIPWKDHERWLAVKLADPNCHLFVGLNERGEPIGPIRFDQEGVEAELHVSVGPEQRGHGYGTGLIRAGTEAVFLMTEVATFHAFVKRGNEVSLRAFRGAGFSECCTETGQGFDPHHLLLERP